MRLLILICFLFSLNLYSQKRFEHLPPTKENIMLVLHYHDLTHKKYVLAQAIQETSLKPKGHNNLFGLTGKNGLYKYPHWSYSIKDYKEKIQSRRKEGENYLAFLKRIRYATCPTYTQKIAKIVKTI